MRLPGNLLQAVDAPKPYVQAPGVAKLIDRPREAVRNLSASRQVLLGAELALAGLELNPGEDEPDNQRGTAQPLEKACPHIIL